MIMGKKIWADYYCKRHRKQGIVCSDCKAEKKAKRAFRRAQVALCVAIGGARSILESGWRREGQAIVEAGIDHNRSSSRLGECDLSNDRLKKEAEARIKEGIPQTTHKGPGKRYLPSNEAAARSERCYNKSDKRFGAGFDAIPACLLDPEWCIGEEHAPNPFYVAKKEKEGRDKKMRDRRLDRKVKQTQQNRRLSHPKLDATTCLWMGVANPAREKPAAEARFYQSIPTVDISEDLQRLTAEVFGC